MMDFLSNASCNVHIFPEVVSLFLNELTDGASTVMLREFIPCVDHSLAEEVLSDI